MIYTELSEKYEEKIKEFQPNIYSYILSLYPNKADAEDILQEVNFILIKKESEYDYSKSFKGWCFAIARYQVMAHRSKHARSKISFSDTLVDAIHEDFDYNEDFSLQKKAFALCFKKLPEHMCEIAELRFKEDYSLKDIAIKTNRTIGAVSATLFRIRSNLSKCIKSQLAHYNAHGKFKN